jgi:hypothetical protein
MSLNDSLSELERSKLAVWDYPVSDKYTKVQRVLNDLQRTRLSLLLHPPGPLPPSYVRKLNQRHTRRLKERHLAVRAREGGWWRSQIIQPQDSLDL